MARAGSPPSASTLEDDIAAALGWWREAGVDAAYLDEPAAWLAEPESDTPALAVTAPVAKKAAPAPEARIGGPSAHWPTDLAAFRDWWLVQPALDEGGLSPRIAPVGKARAALMILVAMPEEADRDRLLSGAQGALLDGFLRAAGWAREAVYLAALLPRFTPLPDWSALLRQGIGDVLAHHVALAQPKRLLILGRNILPFCGHDPSQGPAALAFFNHEGGRVPALAEVGLERLSDNAQSRARLWKRWLDWTDGTEWQNSVVDTGV